MKLPLCLAIAALNLSGTLITVMNTKEGLVVCADRRLTTYDGLQVLSSSDDKHKILFAAKPSILITFNGTAGVFGQVPGKDWTELLSFQSEAVSYLNRFNNGDEVNWMEFSSAMKLAYLQKVVSRFRGPTKGDRSFPNPDVKAKSIVKFDIFYIGRDKKMKFSLAGVTYSEEPRSEYSSYGQVLSNDLRGDISSIMLFGQQLALGNIINNSSTKILMKKQALVKNMNKTKEQGGARADYLADEKQATEALRYLIYLQWKASPSGDVGPGCDCATLSSAGKFLLTNDLPPLTENDIKFRSIGN